MISQARPKLFQLALNCCAGLLLSGSVVALVQEPKNAPPQLGTVLAWLWSADIRNARPT